MVRYYSDNLPTRLIRAKFPICAKLGNIIAVKGIRFRSRIKNSDGQWVGPYVQERVKVIGTHGTAVFGGLCWGYSGEGPRGLVSLLQFLGVKLATAQRIAHKTPRNEEMGTDWCATFVLDVIKLEETIDGITGSCFLPGKAFENVIPASLVA